MLRNSAAFDTVVGVEINISCPNVANRGLVFACDPDSTAAVVAEVRKELPPQLPAFAKLSPDVTDIVAIARAAVDAGASGLTAINTTLGVAIDALLGPRIPVAGRAWHYDGRMVVTAVAFDGAFRDLAVHFNTGHTLRLFAQGLRTEQWRLFDVSEGSEKRRHMVVGDEGE